MLTVKGRCCLNDFLEHAVGYVFDYFVSLNLWRLDDFLLGMDDLLHNQDISHNLLHLGAEA